MAALTVDFRKHSGPTPADDMAAQIITDCGNFTHCHTHTFAHTAKFVPSGVHWLVTGAVPSRAHPLYPFTWVHIDPFNVCKHRKPRLGARAAWGQKNGTANRPAYCVKEKQTSLIDR